MRRIQRIRQPAAVITQCLHSSPVSAPVLCRATAGASSSSCLASRPRDFGTTPGNSFSASRPWAADKGKIPESRTANPKKTERQPITSTAAPDTAAHADVAKEDTIPENIPRSRPAATATEPGSTQGPAAPESNSLADIVNEENAASKGPSAKIPTESTPVQQVTAPDTQVPIDTADEYRTHDEAQPIHQVVLDPADDIVIAAADEPIKLQQLGPRNPVNVRMQLPPAERTVAPRPDELEEKEDYTPADSATELSVVGGLTNWFVRPSRNDKEKAGPDSADKLAGEKILVKTFARPRGRTEVEPAVKELAVHQAVMEALAVQKVGSPELLLGRWENGFGQQVLKLRLDIHEDGRVEVLGNVSGVVQKLAGKDLKGRGSTLNTALAGSIPEETRVAVRAVSLENVNLKFAVAKRYYQLTGQAIPDAKLLKITHVGSLLETVMPPPPARRLHEAVKRHGALMELPNVKVYATRTTPVHKAKALGLWKVVEKELRKRDLPVLGRDAGSVDRFMAKEWYRGPLPEVKDNKSGRKPKRY